MFIPDLYEFPSGHPPTLYGEIFITRGTLAGRAALPDGMVLRTIGWLGDKVPRIGDTPPQCIARLVGAHDQGYVFNDGTKGWHDCEVCQRGGADTQVNQHVQWGDRTLDSSGRGHFLVLANRPLWRRRVVYMFPELILHYILGHQYRPPDEFVRAVLRGRFLNEDDLVLIDGEPFAP